ncbi:phospholipase D family protein (plasmid) [Cupriavidus pinatubonensis]|uniref:phospholipase D family nuclease n=1 Tax=Cupriavidus pinatubonensis TaxID=248026 RepID=UPI001C72A0E1|nr:phospholipase D family protein [Cupriavidus pinatubonensis]QYY33609.1 phospholipase D family protein [Cupriavidus pinatubonensis]
MHCRLGVAVLTAVSILASNAALAKRPSLLGEIESGVATALQPSSVQVPATGTVEVAFSPNEGAEALVVKVIDSARSEIRMLTYSFTSAPVTAALLRAKKRGVNVAMVVDYKNNLSDDRSGKARAALDAVATAGISVRTISVYPIHHDKTLVVDSTTVETGSFNYSAGAASKNSENVLVMWGNQKLAAVYLKHWERNWNQGSPYQPAY